MFEESFLGQSFQVIKDLLINQSSQKSSNRNSYSNTEIEENMISKESLEKLKINQIRSILSKLGISFPANSKKKELITILFEEAKNSNSIINETKSNIKDILETPATETRNRIGSNTTQKYSLRSTGKRYSLRKNEQDNKSEFNHSIDDDFIYYGQTPLNKTSRNKKKPAQSTQKKNSTSKDKRQLISHSDSDEESETSTNNKSDKPPKPEKPNSAKKSKRIISKSVASPPGSPRSFTKYSLISTPLSSGNSKYKLRSSDKHYDLRKSDKKPQESGNSSLHHSIDDDFIYYNPAPSTHLHHHHHHPNLTSSSKKSQSPEKIKTRKSSNQQSNETNVKVSNDESFDEERSDNSGHHSDEEDEYSIEEGQDEPIVDDNDQDRDEPRIDDIKENLDTFRKYENKFNTAMEGELNKEAEVSVSTNSHNHNSEYDSEEISSVEPVENNYGDDTFESDVIDLEMDENEPEGAADEEVSDENNSLMSQEDESENAAEIGEVEVDEPSRKKLNFDINGSKKIDNAVETVLENSKENSIKENPQIRPNQITPVAESNVTNSFSEDNDDIAKTAFSKLEKKLLNLVKSKDSSDSSLSDKEYSLLKSLIEKHKPSADLSEQIYSESDKSKNQTNSSNSKTKSLRFDDFTSFIPRESIGGSWSSRESFLPSPVSPINTNIESSFIFDSIKKVSNRLPTPFAKEPTKKRTFFEVDPIEKIPGSELYTQSLQKTPRLALTSRIFTSPFVTSPHTGSGSFSIGSGSFLPRSQSNTKRSSYIPTFKPSSSRFTNPIKPLLDNKLNSRIPTRSTASYIEQKRNKNSSGSSASATVAKRILESLGDLTSSIEKSRKRPTPIQWGSDRNQSVPVPSFSPKQEAESSYLKDQSKPKVSFSTSLKSPTQSLKDEKDIFSKFNHINETPEVKTTSYISDIKPNLSSEKLSTNLAFATTSNDHWSQNLTKETSQSSVLVTPSIPSNSFQASKSPENKFQETLDSENGFSFGEPQDYEGLDDIQLEFVGKNEEINYVFSPPKKIKTKNTLISESSSSSSDISTKTSNKNDSILPKSTSEIPNQPSIDIWSKAAKVSGIKCPECWVMNKSDAVKCVSCEKPFNNIKAPAASTIRKSDTIPKPSIWSETFINEGVKCKVCLLKNKKGAKKCVSCESILDTDGGLNETTSDNKPSQQLSKGFTFPVDSSKNDVSSCSSSSLTTKGFVFGSAPVNDQEKHSEVPKSAPSGGFIFGASSSASNENSLKNSATNNKVFTGFSFSSSNQSVEEKSKTSNQFLPPSKLSSEDSSQVSKSKLVFSSEGLKNTNNSISFGFQSSINDKKSPNDSQDDLPRKKRSSNFLDDNEVKNFDSTNNTINFGSTSEVPKASFSSTTGDKKPSSAFSFNASANPFTPNSIKLPSDQTESESKPFASGFTFGDSAKTKKDQIEEPSIASTNEIKFSNGSSSSFSFTGNSSDNTTDKQQKSSISSSVGDQTFGGFAPQKVPQDTANTNSNFTFGSSSNQSSLGNLEQKNPDENLAKPSSFIFGSTALASTPASAIGSSNLTFSSSSTSAIKPTFGVALDNSSSFPPNDSNKDPNPFSSDKNTSSSTNLFGLNSSSASTQPSAATSGFAPFSSTPNQSNSLQTSTFGIDNGSNNASNMDFSDGSNMAPPAMNASAFTTGVDSKFSFNSGAASQPLFPQTNTGFTSTNKSGIFSSSAASPAPFSNSGSGFGFSATSNNSSDPKPFGSFGSSNPTGNLSASNSLNSLTSAGKPFDSGNNSSNIFAFGSGNMNNNKSSNDNNNVFGNSMNPQMSTNNNSGFGNPTLANSFGGNAANNSFQFGGMSSAPVSSPFSNPGNTFQPQGTFNAGIPNNMGISMGMGPQSANNPFAFGSNASQPNNQPSFSLGATTSSNTDRRKKVRAKRPGQ